jgi:hypothetical protein
MPKLDCRSTAFKSVLTEYYPYVYVPAATLSKGTIPSGRSTKKSDQNPIRPADYEMRWNLLPAARQSSEKKKKMIIYLWASFNNKKAMGGAHPLARGRSFH